MLHLKHLEYIASQRTCVRSALGESRREIRSGVELTAITDVRHITPEMRGRLAKERCCRTLADSAKDESHVTRWRCTRKESKLQAPRSPA